MKKLTTFVLVVILIFTLAACGKTEPTESENTTTANPADAAVMTHDEFVAAALDSPVTVDTCIQAKQTFWDGKATLYTQAEGGAYFIYQMPCSQEEYDQLTAGTRIRVTGTKSVWSGEIEIINATYEIIDGNFKAEPLDVTALLGSEQLADHQNDLVKFTGLTVEPKADANGGEAAFLYNWDGSGEEGSDLYFDASINGNKVTFTVESDLCGADTDVYKAVEPLKVGDVIDLTGFLYWYDGANPHVTAVSPAA